MNEDFVSEIERLAKADGQHHFFFGPVPEERVVVAERELGVTFPPSFRAFLLNFGAAYMLGYPFEGLPDVDQSECEVYFGDLVCSTQSQREMREDMPRSWVYISEDGGDGIFYMDTSVCDDDGESPIVVSEHNQGLDGHVVARGFMGFIRKLSAGEPLW